MEDESFDVDIEALCEFFSPAIFDFLNVDNARINTEVCSRSSGLAVGDHHQADMRSAHV